MREVLGVGRYNHPTLPALFLTGGKKMTSRRSGSISYITSDETLFIQELGKGIHSIFSQSVFGKTRMHYLQAYKRALAARSEWGKLDKNIIMATLNNEIKKEAGYAT